jgi:hypothetical protein
MFALGGWLGPSLRIGFESGPRRKLDARSRHCVGAVVVPPVFRLARAHAAAEIAIAVVVTGQVARQFAQRHLVDPPLEFHHHVQRHPVVVPAPGVELGVVGCTQVEVPVLADQLQQEPDLLLTLVVASRVAADVALGNLVAQPVPGARDDAHMIRHQPDLFVQFPEHRLFGTFAAVDAALRELPAVRPDAFAPEHLVFLVEQDDADVRPEAVPVKHNHTPNL